MFGFVFTVNNTDIHKIKETHKKGSNTIVLLALFKYG